MTVSWSSLGYTTARYVSPCVYYTIFQCFDIPRMCGLPFSHSVIIHQSDVTIVDRFHRTENRSDGFVPFSMFYL